MRVIACLCLLSLAACSEWTIRGSGNDDDEPLSEPVADAGEDIVTVPLTDLRLDGRASYDPADYLITGYRWTLLSSPEGSTSELSHADDDQPFFFVDTAGEYTFELTVKNSQDVWDPTPDQVVIDASPNARLYAQLTWDTDVDLDLHLIKGTGPIYQTPGDVCWCNPEGEWGATDNPDDNGVLTAETSTGYGPESATIVDPADDVYHLVVHYYGSGSGSGCDDGICPPTHAELRVFLDGVEVQAFTQLLDTEFHTWRAAEVSFPSGAVVAGAGLRINDETSCF